MTNTILQNVLQKALKYNDIAYDSDIIKNPNNYDVRFILGQHSGELYAFIFKKENTFVSVYLDKSVQYNNKIRQNCFTNKGTDWVATAIEIIQQRLFNQDLNEGYELIEVGALNNPFRSFDIPMLYSL